MKVRWAVNLAAPDGADYLVKDVLQRTATSIWFGPAGIGKTFLILWILYAIAQGRSVFGRRVRQARTLYVALEGRGAIDKRVYALAKSMGECADFGISEDTISLLSTDGRGVRINMPHVEALIALILEHEIGIVMIDTLNLVIGGADENDNAAMGLLMAAASDIARATGAHVGFIGHAPKAGNEGGPRGGGAQKGNADLVVSISGEGVFTASTFAPGGKSKDGSPFKLNFTLKPQDLALDADGDMLRSCVIEEVEQAIAPPAPKLSAARQGWLDDLRDLFAQDGNNAPQRREPLSGLWCLTLTREQVRDGLRKKGRLGDVRPDGSIEPKYRQQMSTALIALKDAKKIGMTDKFVWLL